MDPIDMQELIATAVRANKIEALRIELYEKVNAAWHRSAGARRSDHRARRKDHASYPTHAAEPTRWR